MSATMTADALVAAMDKSIDGLLLASIKRMDEEPAGDGIKMAGFILCACAIDTLAGFHDGLTDPKKGSSATRFKKFVRDFLPNYDPEDLYSALRCGLVHGYTCEGDRYVFGPAPPPEAVGNRTVIKLGKFHADVRQAYADLRRSIQLGGPALDRAHDRYKAMGLIQRHV